MPVRRVHYVANNASFRLHMMGQDTQDAATSASRDIMGIAEAFAPASTPAEKGSGDGTRYEDHFFVDETVVVLQDGAFTNPRRAARVVNDARYAQQVEFGEGTRATPEDRRPQKGTHGTPARPLGRAGAFFSPTDYIGGPPQ